MALDFMAIVSNGTYPTPTPTDTQRAAYGVSFGLLGLIPTGELTTLVGRIIEIGKAGIRIATGLLKIG